LLYPQTFLSIGEFKKALDIHSVQFPIIIKPIYGSGSTDTYIIDSFNKLEVLFHEGLMIQELITGTEYGVDVLNSLDGLPIRCVIKKKLSMRSGETDKALTVADDEILSIACKLATELGHIGNLDFDLIKSGSNIYLIDLNPRFGGGYPATHATGVNYVELLLHMFEGRQVTPEFNNYPLHLMTMKTINIVKTFLSTIDD